MRRGRREARSQVSKRFGELGDHFMRRLARLGLAQPVVAGVRMVVQTNWHAPYKNWKVGARDSGPYAVPGLP
jgi:hypothetical protein